MRTQAVGPVSQLPGGSPPTPVAPPLYVRIRRCGCTNAGIRDRGARRGGVRCRARSVVGNGRVGRTRTLPLKERAALAARAYIRHRHTDYEQKLIGIDALEIDLEELDDPDDLDCVDYQEIKRAAQPDVDAFLDEHRHEGSALA